MKRWIAWIGMIVGAIVFAAADAFAATQEKDGSRVTTSSWIRYGIRKSWLVAVVGVGLIIWHFVVQAYYPNLPL